MTKSNMDIISESSEQNIQNLSIYFSNQSSTNELNSISKKSKTQAEKKMFEVFHKKELIYNENNSQKKDDKSNSQSISYKCFYCENTFSYINRFEAHMRTHVSKFFLIKKYFINIYIDRRKTIQMHLL